MIIFSLQLKKKDNDNSTIDQVRNEVSRLSPRTADATVLRNTPWADTGLVRSV